MDGLPQSFESVAAIERLRPNSGLYFFPNVYPDSHYYADQAHHKAGQPVLMAVVLVFNPEGGNQSNEDIIRPVPCGSVYEVK